MVQDLRQQCLRWIGFHRSHGRPKPRVFDAAIQQADQRSAFGDRVRTSPAQVKRQPESDPFVGFFCGKLDDVVGEQFVQIVANRRDYLFADAWIPVIEFRPRENGRGQARVQRSNQPQQAQSAARQSIVFPIVLQCFQDVVTISLKQQPDRRFAMPCIGMLEKLDELRRCQFIQWVILALLWHHRFV